MERKSIKTLQDEVIQEIGLLDDWLDRYQQIIDLGQALPEPDESLHIDENLIKGCQSRVWMSCQLSDGLLHFQIDSDAVITKGIAALLAQVLDGHTPQEIAESELYFIDRIGLKENLSPTRANGLVAMIERIYECAKLHIQSPQ